MLPTVPDSDMDPWSKGLTNKKKEMLSSVGDLLLWMFQRLETWISRYEDVLEGKRTIGGNT